MPILRRLQDQPPEVVAVLVPTLVGAMLAAAVKLMAEQEKRTREPRGHAGRGLMTDRRIRVVLFDDVWDLALQPRRRFFPLTPEFLAKIAATPSDTPLGRSRREVTCTVEEARELLRVLGEAAGEYARSGDHRRLRLATAGGSNVINAEEGRPGGSGR